MMTSDSILKDFYYLDVNNHVFVKEADFFRSQGGETQPWGVNWIKVQAYSIEDARNRGIHFRKHNLALD
jgi:hypothetical protein